MGVRIPRRKKRVPLLSVLYRLDKWLPFSQRRKLKWYLDLEWIFERLALEASFRHYPAEEHPHRLSMNRFILRHLRSDMKVLDLGCGNGDVANVLAAHVDRVVGVDHDAQAIEQARRRYQRRNLSFIDQDAQDYLRTGELRFDVLVLSHVLEHLDDPGPFLGAFKGFFRWVYIEVPDFDRSFLNHYRKELGNTLIHSDDDHVSEFDREELGELLDRAGIAVVEAEYRHGVQRLWCSTGA